MRTAHVYKVFFNQFEKIVRFKRLRSYFFPVDRIVYHTSEIYITPFYRIEISF